MRKVLIANRGEIALRVIRACADAGLASVAVYAEPDSEAPYVRRADEAFALGGATPRDSYLMPDKLLDAARRSGADAVHPGYGFLSENADFAQAVIDEGLTWIGPGPQAIRDLGDKVTARQIAMRCGAPLVPGTTDPVSEPDEILSFADEHGLPVAVKAAFGGGGRGLKVAGSREEIPELFESAVREAETAFGRGECFVERYLDRPRHVEAQILADRHGTVIVAGTRDCSLQRRHQKLVEEAPAPFLTDEQRALIHTSAKAICREAGYEGAGTVEYLVGSDGTISFLEVNTRLQVEHPVTEETTGLDLVREQFRIAEGQPLRRTDDPEPHGHAIEFRINGEDAARNFLPAPGTVRRFVAPEGPGVRVDGGVESGSVIDGQFDSMLAKVIVRGEDRKQALERSRRALDEMAVDGLPTVLPFHRAVVRDPAFEGDVEHGFTVHTSWIETEFDPAALAQFGGAAEPADPGEPGTEAEPRPPRRTVVVEVDGRRLEVSLPADLSPAPGQAGNGQAGAITSIPRPRKRAAGKGAAGAAAEGQIVAPMQGTVVKVAVEVGSEVQADEVVAVIEAMKMENPVTAPRSGVVAEVPVAPGEAVTQGQTVCTLET
jgi:acetyl-CoA/propionyl-CoA carboxylase biotin carboxyl carrier protein